MRFKSTGRNSCKFQLIIHQIVATPFPVAYKSSGIRCLAEAPSRRFGIMLKESLLTFIFNHYQTVRIIGSFSVGKYKSTTSIIQSIAAKARALGLIYYQSYDSVTKKTHIPFFSIYSFPPLTFCFFYCFH